jgi:hypothetical protein
MPPLAPLAAGSSVVPAVDAAAPSFGELLVQLEKTLKAEHLADTQVTGGWLGAGWWLAGGSSGARVGALYLCLAGMHC